MVTNKSRDSYGIYHKWSVGTHCCFPWAPVAMYSLVRILRIKKLARAPRQWITCISCRLFRKIAYYEFFIWQMKKNTVQPRFNASRFNATLTIRRNLSRNGWLAIVFPPFNAVPPRFTLRRHLWRQSLKNVLVLTPLSQVLWLNLDLNTNKDSSYSILEAGTVITVFNIQLIK
jgi:hypothetical protein